MKCFYKTHNSVQQSLITTVQTKINMSDFIQKLSECPSLYIPRVFVNIGGERIRAIFEGLDFGKVSKIDFVRHQPANNGKPYNSVYIHFEYMYDTEMVNKFIVKIKTGSLSNPARIVYDDPWYWVVLENIKPKQHIAQINQNLNTGKPLATGKPMETSSVKAKAVVNVGLESFVDLGLEADVDLEADLEALKQQQPPMVLHDANYVAHLESQVAALMRQCNYLTTINVATGMASVLDQQYYDSPKLTAEQNQMFSEFMPNKQ